MLKLYFTRNEIFKKFNILLYNIDKVYFSSEFESDSELQLQVEQNSKIIFELSVKRHNDKLYRDIKGENNLDLKLKLALNKFLEVVEVNFNIIMRLSKLTNIDLSFCKNEIDYNSGSKSRVRVFKRLYVDVNVSCNNNCLLFLDSEYDTSYSYFTLLDINSGKIIESSILDTYVLKIYEEYKKDLIKLLNLQNELKGEIEWN